MRYCISSNRGKDFLSPPKEIERIQLRWHKFCLEISCQLSNAISAFLNLIPQKIEPKDQQSPKDFTRERRLPFHRLIVLILSLTASGKRKGVDIKSGEFFEAARRSGLWPDAESVHKSAFTKARKKVVWTIFRDLLQRAVKLAYSLLPADPAYVWHGMTVLAIDGSKYDLPATDALRAEFDPQSGFEYPGKGHYPQCLVTTIYDVFRRFPVARSVVDYNGSERDQAMALLSEVPANCVLLHDRGYPSFEFLLYLIKHYAGYFVLRSPATSTFSAVNAFMRSGREEDIIEIAPSTTYLKKVKPIERKKVKPIRLRVIRLVAPDGKVSVLITNLFDKACFPKEEIIALYFRRWAVEDHYRTEKVALEIEMFHGKTPNSIRQELFAVAIMSVIARTLMALRSDVDGGPTIVEFQFKNAVMTLARNAAVLAAEDPEKAIEIFSGILDTIAKVKYYRSKKVKPHPPRVTKKHPSKWCVGRSKKAKAAKKAE